MASVPFFINPTSLQTQVSSTTFARGAALYRNHCVLDVEIDEVEPGALELEGEVQGSLPEPYWVNVSLQADAGGQIGHFDGHCTCPVVIDCKHAVALALWAAYASAPLQAVSAMAVDTLSPSARKAAVAEQTRLLAQRNVDQWLEQFAEAVPAPVAKELGTPAQPDQVVYMLAPAKRGNDAVLHIGFGLSRPLRKGGWGQVRAMGYGTPASATPQDREAIQLLQTLGVQTYGYSVSTMLRPLGGEVGQLALRLAASTGRLFYAPDGRTLELALALGPARALAWHWEEDNSSPGNPAWVLQARLDGTDAQLLRNTPPLYLDLVAGVCGWVEAPGVAAHDLGVLLKAPPIPQASFDRHQATLLRRLAHLPLPPAIERPQLLQGVAPVAHLHLSPVVRAEVALRGLVEARLAFDYAGYRHQERSPLNPLLLDAQGTQVLVERDLDAEQAALLHLRQLGLVEDPQGRWGLPPRVSVQPPVWLQWADADFAPLREAGFVLTLDSQLHHWITRADKLHVEMEPEGGSAAWFDLSLGVEINGQRHNILPWLPALIDQIGPASTSPDSVAGTALPEHVYLPHADGSGYLRVPTEPLRPWLQALLDLVGERDHGFDVDGLRLSRLEALRVGAALGEGAQWSGAASLHHLVQQLAGRVSLPTTPAPAGLVATLRPYQQLGLDWLQFLRAHGLAGVLADDMGLGKTLQTLAHILVEKEAGRLQQPALIVAPVSLMGNWLREAARFTPGLRVVVVHGPHRHATASDLGLCDIVITPYSLLQRDRERWLAQPWHLVVLDEAQNIKNASTGAAQVASELNATHRLCLSGTPMENHLGELWSLFHFLMPGFLGSQKRFKELFRSPIEKNGDSERLAQLRSRVTPFMLRRTKRDVATELPDKVENIAGVTLDGKQADLYETIRLTTEKAVREALADKGLAKSQIQILDALLKLRQVCCDPRLVPLASAQKIKHSAKLDLLMELLPEMLAEGRRVLLFSQFTSMLELIEEALQARGLSWVKLTGQSKNRDALIDRFTSGEVPLFLISLKAGGVGLNLPQADTVIHYDPWWNPAVENQATDRAHRIGQKNRVFVYKLVAHGTIEERILALQERKAALAESMYSGAQARKQPLFTEGDIAELLKPLGA
jgi:superfamily II DNA or RNA helicase